MADEGGDIGEGSAGGELFGDEGVTEVVDFGPFDTGDFKVAIDGGANVSNQKRITGFGEEKRLIVGFGADIDVIL